MPRSYWERDLPPPSPPREPPSRVDVLIVGAGFMGRWLAYFLSRLPKPPRVLVVERDHFGRGASTRNAGFLTCGQVSEMLADERDSGRDAVIQNFLDRRRGAAIVRDEFPDLAIDPCGSTDHDPVTDATRDLIRELQAACGEQCFDIRPSRLGDRVQPTVFNPEDAGLHPVRLLRLLQDRAGSAEFAFGLEARSVANGYAHFARDDGRDSEIAYDRAYLCLNAFDRDLAPASTVIPGRGQIIVTSPVASPTDRTLGFLNRGYEYFRFVDGRLLLGGGRDRFAAEATDEMLPTDELRRFLRDTAARVIGHGDWKIACHWAGVMGFPAGRHLGGSPRRTLDTKTESIAGFGGMGVSLTPLWAKRVAAEWRG